MKLAIRNETPGTTPASGPVTGHRRDIQGLRAVAVILVVADHADLPLRGGFIGVDVFFVVSGYVITLLLLRELETTGRIRIGAFYARRARRILPAASVVLVVVLAYAANELAVSRVQQIREDATWSALFGANLHFAELTGDYFARDVESSPLLHYWSLAVEEQFYLVWPVLLALMLWTGCSRRLVMGLVTVGILGSLTWAVVHTASAPGVVYFSTPARGWELAVGALLALGHDRLAALGRASRLALAWLGVGGIAMAAVTYGPGSAFPGWRALLPVLATSAVVAAGTAGPSVVVTRVLGLAPIAWLGDLSFSLYLWHWPVLVLGREHVEALGRAAGTGLLLGLTVVLSIWSFHLVENPLRRARLLHHGARGLVLWPATLALVAVSAVAAGQHSARLLEARIGGAPAAAAALPTSPTAGAAPGPGTSRRTGPPRPPAVRPLLDEALRQADSGAPVPFPLTNVPDLFADSWHLAYPCNASDVMTSTQICPVGPVRSRRTLVVYGDSRAGHWLPALDEFGRTHGYRVLPVIKYGCPPYAVPLIAPAGSEFASCLVFRAWALEQIRDIDPAVVVLGADANGWRGHVADSVDRPAVWAVEVARTVRTLRELGATVVTIADIPVAPFEPEDCLTDPDSTLGGCLVLPTGGAAAANAQTELHGGAEGAGHVDATPLICVRDRCPLVVGRSVNYSDATHLSVTWVRRIADQFGWLLARELAEASAGPEGPERPR